MGRWITGPVGQWAAGILASVLAALIVWWLTLPGGPGSSGPPSPEPATPLSIISTDIGDAQPSGSAAATVSVYNNTSRAIEDCRVWWYSGSEVAAQLAKGLLPQTSAVSQIFGLRPAETKAIAVQSLPYTEPGDFNSELEVICAGTDMISDRLGRRVHVRPN